LKLPNVTERVPLKAASEAVSTRRADIETAHDFTVAARRVVEQAIGEHRDASPLPETN
jgi:hypothetical protein